MAESNEVLTLLDKEDTYANLYLDLIKKTTDVLDAYLWLTQAEACEPGRAAEQLSADAATAAVDEFEKVTQHHEKYPGADRVRCSGRPTR